MRVAEILLPLMAMLALTKAVTDNQPFNATVNLNSIRSTVDERFLSIALDCSIIYYRWYDGDFDFRNTTKGRCLKRLARALRPAYLRLGGHRCNFMRYEANAIASTVTVPANECPVMDSDGMTQFQNVETFTMNKTDWININKWAKKCNLPLLFMLNPFIRDSSSTNHHWDPTNAKEILDISIKKKYASNQHFTLGNEPNSYGFSVNCSISAESLSNDTITLLDMLRNDPKYSSYYANAMVPGPEVTDNKFSAPGYSTGYLQNFPNGGVGYLAAASTHYYVLNGSSTSYSEFTSGSKMDILAAVIARLKAAMSAASSSLSIWLTETASAYGGGAPGLSNTFPSGFIWLDTLGMSARLGLKVVIRQTFMGGNYGLLNRTGIPTPDYYMAWLFKKLVGKKVLSVKKNQGTSRFRVYSHCTPTEKGRYNRYKNGNFNGSVTVFGMNTHNVNISISIDEFGASNTKVDVYILTAHDGQQSSTMDLNGQELKLGVNCTLPLWPRVIKKLAQGERLLIPRESLFFLVYKCANATVCHEA